MLDALRILGEGGDPRWLFRKLAAHFRSILGYEAAALLRPSDHGHWETWISSKSGYSSFCLTAGSVVERIHQGEVVVCFDREEAPRSAVLFELRLDDSPLIVALLHNASSQFSRRHARLAERFRPLLNQALRSAVGQVAQGKLRQLQNQREIQLAQIRLLQDGTAALGIGMFAWDGEREPTLPSRTLLDMIQAWGTLSSWWSASKKAIAFETLALRLWGGETVELSITPPQGETQTFSLTASASAPAESALRTILVTDSTASREIERDRAVAERRYRTLFDSAQQGIVVLDRNGQVLEANTLAAELLHLSDRDLGISWFDLHEQANRDEARVSLRRVFHGETARYEAILEGRNGSKFVADVSASALEEEAGAAAQAVFRDITAQKKAETRLKHDEARKSAVLAAALDCIISIDEAGTVLEFNPAAETTFGWTREEAIGKKMAELFIPQALQEQHSRGLARFIDTGEEHVLGRRLELPAVTRDGRQILTEAAITRTYAPDGSLVFTGFLRDITGQKAAQKAVEEARKAAESASRAKSDFLASMSHELRTPLHVIAGMTALASEQAEDRDFGEILEVIDASTRSLLALIDDLLDISQIESGALSIQQEDFDLHTLLDETRSMFSYRAKEESLSFSWSVAEELPRVVRSDPARLRQILVNLLSNAFKFTAEGEVRLSAFLRHTRSRPELVIRVSDTGVGFDMSQQARLFERFERLEHPEIDQAGTNGVGLGLAISHGLAELLGGSLTAESALGLGSVFSLEIPISVPKTLRSVDRPNRQDGDEAAPIPMRILLVDDHPDNRLLAQRVLSRQGHDVTVADSGEGAIQALAKETPQLVLMDIEMPGWDGFETTRQLRKAGLSEDVPIIALTAHAAPGYRQRCLEGGLDGYLAKPFTKSQLLELVAQFSQARSQPRDFPRSELVLGDGWIVSVDAELIDLVPGYLERMKEAGHAAISALKDQDFQSIRSHAHRIMGTGSSFGFSRITEIGSALHTACVHEDIQQAELSARELIDYLENVRYQARSASSK